MKKIIGLFLLAGFLLGIGLISAQSSARRYGHDCWYNPKVGNCDTGGTIACIAEACK